MRTGRSVETSYDHPDIVFRVDVSAFTPIRSIKIDGKAVIMTPATWVVVLQPYRLEPGENRIVVEATTEFGTARQEFVINLKIQKEGEAAEKMAKGGFQLIAMGGAQTNSNPLRLPKEAGQVKGTRGFVLLIPRYDWDVGAESVLRLGSIFARDIYDSGKLESLEVALTQLRLSWINGDPRKSAWTLGAGYNYIDAGYDNLLTGKTHLEDDSFVFGDYRLGFRQTGLWGLNLEYKYQNLAEDPVNPDANEDARVVTLRTSLAGGATLRGKVRLAYANHDAVGKLKDQTIGRVGLEGAYALGSFIPSLALRYKQTSFKETDPLLGVAAENRLATAVLTVNYQLSDSWVLMAEALADRQSSNDPPQEYENTSFMLAVIYIY